MNILGFKILSNIAKSDDFFAAMIIGIVGLISVVYYTNYFANGGKFIPPTPPSPMP